MQSNAKHYFSFKLLSGMSERYLQGHDWNKPREIMDKSHMRVAHHILSAKEFQGYFSEELK